MPRPGSWIDGISAQVTSSCYPCAGIWAHASWYQHDYMYTKKVLRNCKKVSESRGTHSCFNFWSCLSKQEFRKSGCFACEALNPPRHSLDRRIAWLARVRKSTFQFDPNDRTYKDSMLEQKNVIKSQFMYCICAQWSVAHCCWCVFRAAKIVRTSCMDLTQKIKIKMEQFRTNCGKAFQEKLAWHPCSSLRTLSQIFRTNVLELIRSVVDIQCHSFCRPKKKNNYYFVLLRLTLPGHGSVPFIHIG